jgi:hypothetical protein
MSLSASPLCVQANVTVVGAMPRSINMSASSCPPQSSARALRASAAQRSSCATPRLVTCSTAFCALGMHPLHKDWAGEQGRNIRHLGNHAAQAPAHNMDAGLPRRRRRRMAISGMVPPCRARGRACVRVGVCARVGAHIGVTLDVGVEGQPPYVLHDRQAVAGEPCCRVASQRAIAQSDTAIVKGANLSEKCCGPGRAGQDQGTGGRLRAPATSPAPASAQGNACKRAG